MADLGDYDEFDLRAYDERVKKLRPNELPWVNQIEHEALARREARRAFAVGRNVLLLLVGAYALLVLWIWWRAGNPLDNLRGALWFVLFIPMLWVAYSRKPETRTARRKTVGTWTLWSLAGLGALVAWGYLNGQNR